MRAMADSKTMKFTEDQPSAEQVEKIKGQLDEWVTRAQQETRRKLVLNRLIREMVNHLQDAELARRCVEYVDAVEDWKDGDGPKPPL